MTVAEIITVVKKKKTKKGQIRLIDQGARIIAGRGGIGVRLLEERSTLGRGFPEVRD